MELICDQHAPVWEGIGTDNQLVTSGDFHGQRLVLYFYPKDNTSGCTKEAQDFATHFESFSTKNTAILGVSPDSVQSHQKFREKYDLPFNLISDPDKMICQAFGVWKEKSMYGRTYMGVERTTFLINEKGIIRHIWNKVKVPGHVQAVLETL